MPRLSTVFLLLLSLATATLAADPSALQQAPTESHTQLRGGKPQDSLVNSAPLSLQKTEEKLPVLELDVASSTANDTATEVVPPASEVPVTKEPVPEVPAGPTYHPILAWIALVVVVVVHNGAADVDSVSMITATTATLVTVFTLILEVDVKGAIALAVATVAGGELVTFIDNVRESARDPTAPPLIDWDLLLIIQPSLLLGTLVGVVARYLIPSWFLSSIFATMLLVTGSLLLQASHRRTQAANQEAEASINEGSTLLQQPEGSTLLQKPQQSAPAPSFAQALQIAPLAKVGTLVAVVFVSFLLHAALVFVVPMILLGYLVYRAYKSSLEAYEHQQLPRVFPAEHEVKWSIWLVKWFPVATGAAGMVTGIIGLTCDIVLHPFFIKYELDQSVSHATTASLVLFSCLFTAMEGLLLEGVSFGLLIVVIATSFALKLFGNELVARAVPIKYRSPAFLLFVFAIMTLASGILLAIACT